MQKHFAFDPQMLAGIAMLDLGHTKGVRSNAWPQEPWSEVGVRQHRQGRGDRGHVKEERKRATRRETLAGEVMGQAVSMIRFSPGARGGG